MKTLIVNKSTHNKLPRKYAALQEQLTQTLEELRVITQRALNLERECDRLASDKREIDQAEEQQFITSWLEIGVKPSLLGQ